jgi:hypothetical protein
MSIKNSDEFSELEHLPLNKRFKKDLFKAYQKYLAAKAQEDGLEEDENTLVSEIADIAAELFIKTTKIWDKAKKRHEDRGIKSYDERYILNPAEKMEIDDKINTAQDDVKKSLSKKGYSVRATSNCYDLLLEWFQTKEHVIDNSMSDLNKKVLKIIKSVYYNLFLFKKKSDVKFLFSSDVEDRRYYTFEKFFGTKFDKLRK